MNLYRLLLNWYFIFVVKKNNKLVYNKYEISSRFVRVVLSGYLWCGLLLAQTIVPMFVVEAPSFFIQLTFAILSLISCTLRDTFGRILMAELYWRGHGLWRWGRGNAFPLMVVVHTEFRLRVAEMFTLTMHFSLHPGMGYAWIVVGFQR